MSYETHICLGFFPPSSKREATQRSSLHSALIASHDYGFLPLQTTRWSWWSVTCCSAYSHSKLRQQWLHILWNAWKSACMCKHNRGTQHYCHCCCLEKGLALRWKPAPLGPSLLTHIQAQLPLFADIHFCCATFIPEPGRSLRGKEDSWILNWGAITLLNKFTSLWYFVVNKGPGHKLSINEAICMRIAKSWPEPMIDHLVKGHSQPWEHRWKQFTRRVEPVSLIEVRNRKVCKE